MYNFNSNIELSSSSPQQNIASPSQHSGYLPQRDEDSPLESQSQPHEQHQPEAEADLWIKFSRKKIIKYIIRLMLCLFLLDIAFLCYGFYFFGIQSSDRSLTIDLMREALSWIKADLNADPIMEIKIMDRGSTCPAGFEILKLGVWPGTKAGCLCENGHLYRGSCDKIEAEKSEKCEKDIPSTQPREMYEWDGSIWCIKRAVLGTDYLRKAECPSGFQECYPGGCFVEGLCPITKIVVDSNRALSLEKTKGGLPVIDVRITFGDIPCFTQDLFDRSIKNSTYQLSAIQENSCDKYGLDAQFSTQLASQTAYESFTKNYFPASVMHLPYFEGNMTAAPSILSSKVRMKTAKHDSCLNFNEDFVYVYTEAYHKFLWIVAFLTVNLFFRLSCLFYTIHLVCGKPETKLFSEISDDASCLRFCDLITLISTMIGLIPARGYFQAYQVLKAGFEKYNALECFAGGQGDMMISDLLERARGLEVGFWSYRLIVIINVSYILIHILLYVGKKISSR